MPVPPESMKLRPECAAVKIYSGRCRGGRPQPPALGSGRLAADERFQEGDNVGFVARREDRPFAEPVVERRVGDVDVRPLAWRQIVELGRAAQQLGAHLVHCVVPHVNFRCLAG